MDLQTALKLLGALAGIATAAGGGAKLGYDTRDGEVQQALERSKCKIADLKESARQCGWTRPDDWCALLEEQ